MIKLTKRSSGISSFDETIDHLRLGDNVVFQVNAVLDYVSFVKPYVENSLNEGRKLIYIRFAEHNPLTTDERVIKYELDASEGFESFSSTIYDIATKEGEEAYYLFDCLSYLLPSWASDLMIGNFFYITCPYLYELNTIAYFAILKNSHSFTTIAKIRETTQLLIDIFRVNDKKYMQPLKVYKRYHPMMFLPHEIDDDQYRPVEKSIQISGILENHLNLGALAKHDERNLDYWERLFIDAKDIYLKTKGDDSKEAKARRTRLFDKITKLILAKEEKILSLVNEYFDLKDLLEIQSRMVGSGFIGGKSLGMLIARKILESNDFSGSLEGHDSFYIGSDVFYSYIVQNGWWRLRMQQRSERGYFKYGRELRRKMKKGVFPDDIKAKFMRILEYFGQAPIIVRSSSLLEDAFGNAFAGKYESYFLVNQGDPEERFIAFEEAVKKVYASSMNEDALAYRRHWKLEKSDEQMCILVQRVSGGYHGNYFFPDLAGVGISYNTYVWDGKIKPESGMLRLVYGLGTRAVDRLEDDYPRIVSLDYPTLKPHSGIEDTRRFSQHMIDLLDISQNQEVSLDISRLSYPNMNELMSNIAIYDHETQRRMNELGLKDRNAYVLTFDKLFKTTNLASTMQKMLKTLEASYDHPVDIEYTINFTKEFEPKINLLQCRPLQVRNLGKEGMISKKIGANDKFIEQTGDFMGGNIDLEVEYLVFVNAKSYHGLNASDKYKVARTIGQINRLIAKDHTTMLIGPGRWGTSTIALGVPVSFAEINRMKVIAEYATEDGVFSPELSFGSHFFQDLVETGIFYLALFEHKKDAFYNKKWIEQSKNEFLAYFNNVQNLEEVEMLSKAIKIIQLRNHPLMLQSDIKSQKLIAFFKENE